jgi:Fe-S cluster assembly protein SufD
MSTVENIKENLSRLQAEQKDSSLRGIRQSALNNFDKLGIPGTRHEEWKYTRISALFNKEYQLPVSTTSAVTPADVDVIRLPGCENAHQLVFINGIYAPALSHIHTNEELVIIPLEEAANNEFATVVAENLGHSSKYAKDGINALNTAWMYGGVFIHVKKARIAAHPVYIYNITDARSENILAQPRSLVHLSRGAQVQIVETFATLGLQESFTNQVIEMVVEEDARLEYYKIQNDSVHANQVSTTHVRQRGKSYAHTLTISLNGNVVRNNLNIVMEASHCESHLYGLYLQKGNSHIDNHTLVDNVEPHCYSNELYKGVMDENATGVFNGKIFVRKDAQKTNAYQSNKNILLSNNASVNTKPQLEIFADDVKCSHGCTIGSLDTEAMFYLRSRGVTEKNAKSLLMHAFADDILENIKPEAIRNYVDQLISERLEFDRL